MMLLNPGLKGKIAATSTLYAGIQLIMRARSPGPIITPVGNPVHHRGRGRLHRGQRREGGDEQGDYLTTPPWAWHDHGNEGNEPVMWLDGLDIPFVLNVDAVFYEEFPPRRSRSAGRSTTRCAAGARTSARPSRRRSARDVTRRS